MAAVQENAGVAAAALSGGAAASDSEDSDADDASPVPSDYDSVQIP